MTGATIKHMVDRFLCWKLPADFSPDGGISFQKVSNAGTPARSSFMAPAQCGGNESAADRHNGGVTRQ